MSLQDPKWQATVDRRLADVDQTEGLHPYPRFSLAERDRRWGIVRARMAAEGLDVIVTPQNTGHSTDFQANTRWLTQVGGGADADIAAVFPIEGEVTIAATTAKLRWPGVQNWVTDCREAGRNYGKVIVERLKELNPRTIGIAGLSGGTRTPEGTILHGTYAQIRDAFPNADIRNVMELLGEARYVKSQEEIAFLARSKQLIDDGTEAQTAAARPGATDWEVWADALHAMLRGGSELSVHVNWISGRKPIREMNRPTHRILERGDIIMSELEASWGGYRCQGVAPVGVGQPDPVYQELIKVQGELYEELLADLKPGRLSGELAEKTVRRAAQIAPKTGPAAAATAVLSMHGRGAGDDGPIITGGASREQRNFQIPLQENMVFIFKPTVRASVTNHYIQWGDSVVVTRDGGRRLGRLPHGIAIGGGA
ncbi:MAG: Aminopeptidase family protein [Chloroflexi bacterium]|nr:Aminopeptidase family protein [Chloroflexota bacterium]